MNEETKNQDLKKQIEGRFHSLLLSCPDVGGSLQDIVEWYLEKALDEVLGEE